jgi:GTP-binding protein EngB required for normal cell division
MSEDTLDPIDNPNRRKPVIALMGEFSAGKSTLTNLLIGEPALPTKVTATQLPPVWIKSGTGGAERVDLQGNAYPVDVVQAGGFELDDTAYISVEKKTDILDLCDLIDMPGISDPNMSSMVWQRVLHNADAIVWCTHATQAWRQSEAAVWETIPPALQQRSLLLLTRFDKITDANDRRRVVKRVTKETDGLFADVFPVSLTDALAAGDDREAWEKSGAEAFVLGLLDLVYAVTEYGTDDDRMAPVDGPVSNGLPIDVLAEVTEDGEDAVEVDANPSQPSVLPRRVERPQSGETTTARPPRQDGPAQLL